MMVGSADKPQQSLYQDLEARPDGVEGSRASSRMPVAMAMLVTTSLAVGGGAAWHMGVFTALSSGSASTVFADAPKWAAVNCGQGEKKAVEVWNLQSEATKHEVTKAAETWKGQSEATKTAEVTDAKSKKIESVGTTLPLGVVSNGYGGFQLTIGVSVPTLTGFSETQTVLVDTGSSILALCESSLAGDLDNYKLSEKLACARYGSPSMFEGWWGNWYSSPIEVDGKEAPAALYSVMAEEEGMTCTNGLNGIFGIAFKSMENVLLTNETPSWADPPSTSDQCPDVPQSTLTPPLIQQLRSMAWKEKLGIYWSGEQGDSEGALYLDTASTSNSYYGADGAVKARLGENGYYEIMIEQFTANGQNFTGFPCSFNPQTGPSCFLDTGTPNFVLPDSVYNEFFHVVKGQSELKSTVTADTVFEMQLKGEDDKSSTLTFNVQKLAALGGMQPGGSNASESLIIIGLPIFAFYYTVVDLDEHMVTFVPLS